MPNRTLICTVAALASGLFGFWAGGQINLVMERQACEQRSWSFDAICKLVVVPGALLKGSVTGLWVGGILGAFFAGSLTREATVRLDPEIPSEAPSQPKQAELSVDWAALRAHQVQLTVPQDEAMRCFLVLLATQNPSEGLTNPLPHPQYLSEAQELLSPLGFSEAAIIQAWQMFQATKQQNS